MPQDGRLLASWVTSTEGWGLAGLYDNNNYSLNIASQNVFSRYLYSLFITFELHQPQIILQ